VVRCNACGLENAEGALYCARCHAALPRPLAPGECLHCGFIPEVPGTLWDVCPSCGNDPERGKEVRAKRIAALRAGVEVEQSRLDASVKSLPARRRFGCLPFLLLLVGVFLLLK
jgi:hypothetical protein